MPYCEQMRYLEGLPGEHLALGEITKTAGGAAERHIDPEPARIARHCRIYVGKKDCGKAGKIFHASFGPPRVRFFTS